MEYIVAFICFVLFYPELGEVALSFTGVPCSPQRRIAEPPLHKTRSGSSSRPDLDMRTGHRSLAKSLPRPKELGSICAKPRSHRYRQKACNRFLTLPVRSHGSLSLGSS